MHHIILKSSLPIIALFFGTSVLAADPEKPIIELSGFFDSYYSYNFNRPKAVTSPNASSVSSASLPPATNTYHYYDTYHNQMTLNLAELSVKAKYSEVSFFTDFDFGPFADLNATISSPSGSSGDEVSKHIGQAVITYRATGSNLFFEAGKMYTHVGLETAKSKDNLSYSRTVLFTYGIPFWHTGIHLGFDIVPEKLQTGFYIYNGWNSIYDNNDSKTLGVQVKYAPSTSFNIVYNFLSGAEQTDNESALKTVHEINSTWIPNDRWTLAVDLLSGSENNVQVGGIKKRADWFGGLLLVKYSINEKSYISPRYEFYQDADGYTLGAVSQTIQSVTLTYSQLLTQGLELKSEFRLDKSNEKTFITKTDAKDLQATMLAALLFTF